MRNVIIILAAAVCAACSGEKIPERTAQAAASMDSLAMTDPMSPDDLRIRLLERFQEYSDSLGYMAFEEYLVSPENVADSMDNAEPILHCYRMAFDKVLDGLQHREVKDGEAAVWLLYNMGIVVKTPSGSFAIDPNHRLSDRLAPYIDFLCVTHNHDDHKCVALMEEMLRLGKPVLSNWYDADSAFCSTVPAEYGIGDFTVRTAMADHNDRLLNFITMFRIDCGESSGHFTILHCGDSNFIPEQFANVAGPVDLLVERNGAKVENRILEDGLVEPGYAMLSHIIELRHRIDSSPKRFRIMPTLRNAGHIRCDNVFLPFWGEGFLWSDGRLTKM